jgi:hypothetical protein
MPDCVSAIASAGRFAWAPGAAQPLRISLAAFVCSPFVVDLHRTAPERPPRHHG